MQPRSVSQDYGPGLVLRHNINHVLLVKVRRSSHQRNANRTSANAVSSTLMSDYEWNLTLHVLSKSRNQSVFMDSRKHVQSNQRQRDLLIQSCVLRSVSRMIWFLW
ncbi:uncharacterized protein LOC117210144 [Bombus bifarius]|uniref:Uncharacterized protein LOC117210144 n=1 Tax=Bombus bifarius TaxID=103933 RepID=A0A6P8N284_9HYME|nr:uncharacterized protein LOC117164478 [Bombus vancouverensis nearcticus]XP_033308760.1 uncharacterized protein LOC117210144 [Bombus bifarius]